MQMDSGWDTGDVLYQREVFLAKDETGGSSMTNWPSWGRRHCLKPWMLWSRGKSPHNPRMIPRPPGPKADERVGTNQWEKPAENLERLVRAMNPWPLAYCTTGGSPAGMESGGRSGRTRSSARYCPQGDPERGIGVACGEGILYLTAVQPRPVRSLPPGLYQRLRDYPGEGSG